MRIDAEFVNENRIQWEIDGLWDKCWANVNHNERLGYLDFKKVSELFDTHDGETIVVVAAGPSVEKAIANKETVNRYPVIVVDRVLEKALHGGLRVDYVVTADPGCRCAFYFPEKGIEGKKVAVSYASSEAVYSRLEQSGADIYQYANEPDDSIFWGAFVRELDGGREYTYLKAGTVVTFTACDLAVKMGARRVVTIGNDLSVTESTLKEELKHNPTTTQKVKGTDLITNNAFAIAALDFQNLPVAYPAVDFVDISGGIEKTFWRKSTLEEEL